jgi:nitronate monooxygenase
MLFDTPLARRLGLDHPLVQAPMAGETATVELALESSRAGALGSIGAPYYTPQRLRDAIRALHAATKRSFNINLFMPLAWSLDPARETAFRAELARAHAELGLEPPTPPTQYEESFDAQIAVVLEEVPPVFSFTFGLPSADLLAALHARNIYVIGTATTVAEARALEERGVDAVVAQGMEAGGHRGSFLKPISQSLIGTMALVPQMVDAVKIPVIAAGGIGDGRGVAAALCLGAQAAALGSTFLLAEEAGTSAPYRAALQGPTIMDTTLTKAFSGRPARGLRNDFLERLEGRDDIIPDFPIPNAWSRPMRQAAAKQGKADYLSLWAGQAASLARPDKAAAIIGRVMAEAKGVLKA